MNTEYLLVKPSGPLCGEASLNGAKNAVLVTMASLLLVRGVSRLYNVPNSSDVKSMICVLESLGARVKFVEADHMLEIDTSQVYTWRVAAQMMSLMRASILVMGSLLARFGQAEVAIPGGCVIGSRPIDYHLKSFIKMGVDIQEDAEYVYAKAHKLKPTRIILEYPSVGATENIMLAATAVQGQTTIINAALEPEVLDLIKALTAMGASIHVQAPATIIIKGGHELHPIDFTIMVDRLEAGSLLLAAAVTGGAIYLPTAQAYVLDVFLAKLEEMGHRIETGIDGVGIRLIATKNPRAVSFKTGPYPGFPTDLQAPMMLAQCIAQGKSLIEETVFENRLLQVPELLKMGSKINAGRSRAEVEGVSALIGTKVVATDIRASCALVLAGLVAHGSTIITGVHHWKRGYESLEQKLVALGASISIVSEPVPESRVVQGQEKNIVVN